MGGFIGPVLLGVLAGCGPSYRSLHESHVLFERCYAMDEETNVGMTTKTACWKAYEASFASESADRARYAQNRVRSLQEISAHPTDEMLMSAAPGSSEVHVKTPMPDSASGLLPGTADSPTGKHATAR